MEVDRREKDAGRLPDIQRIDARVQEESRCTPPDRSGAQGQPRHRRWRQWIGKVDLGEGIVGLLRPMSSACLVAAGAPRRLFPVRRRKPSRHASAAVPSSDCLISS